MDCADRVSDKTDLKVFIRGMLARVAGLYLVDHGTI